MNRSRTKKKEKVDLFDLITDILLIIAIIVTGLIVWITHEVLSGRMF